MAKVVHITPDLSMGGAQMILYKLVSHTDLKRLQCFVICLTELGELGKKLQAQGVPVHALGMKSGMPNPLKLFKLIRMLRRERPDLIQSWLYPADLLGSLAAKFVNGTRLVWGVHHASFNPSWTAPKTILLAKVNATLSGALPDTIVYCSENALAAHLEIGFCPRKSLVIPNGIDTTEFHPDETGRRAVRSEFGLAPDTPLIGSFGRFHPIKGHQKFFEAAGFLHLVMPDVNFVLSGDGISRENSELVRYVEDAGVSSVTHLLGPRNDMARVTAALDVATCSSHNESFSLTLGEAMACGVACVTTDVAGPVSLLGDTGWVVYVGDARALYHTWLEILSLTSEERTIVGRKARKRIVDQFSIESMVKRYEELYEDLLRSGNKKRTREPTAGTL